MFHKENRHKGAMTNSATTPSARFCFRDPIPEIFDAARYLDAAVSAHLTGRRDLAEELIRLADMPAIWEWTESLWGKKSPYVQRPPKESLIEPAKAPHYDCIPFRHLATRLGLQRYRERPCVFVTEITRSCISRHRASLTVPALLAKPG